MHNFFKKAINNSNIDETDTSTKITELFVAGGTYFVIFAVVFLVIVGSCVAKKCKSKKDNEKLEIEKINEIDNISSI